MPNRRISADNQLAPIQEISVQPFHSYNSDNVNRLSRIVSGGKGKDFTAALQLDDRHIRAGALAADHLGRHGDSAAGPALQAQEPVLLESFVIVFKNQLMFHMTTSPFRKSCLPACRHRRRGYPSGLF